MWIWRGVGSQFNKFEQVHEQWLHGGHPHPNRQTRLKTLPFCTTLWAVKILFPLHFRDADKATFLVSSVRSADASLTCTR